MYETDLTDSQWQVMHNVLPTARRRKYSLRLILNALLYLTKSGCQWRLLPNDFQPYAICFYYFRRWQADGHWTRLNKVLVEQDRRQAAPSGQASPSVAVVDAQSIKCSERGVPDKGFDGHKQIQGRKRQLAVDTGGRLLAAHVGPANENDRTGGGRCWKSCTSKALPAKAGAHRRGLRRTALGRMGPGLTVAGAWKRPLA
jgi:transposase